MAESLAFSNTNNRTGTYREIAAKIESMVADEPDVVANLANIAAILKEAFGFFWVGFYLAKNAELVLGPFQGPLACTRIGFDQGVCGHAFSTQKTVIVPNVEEFPGHIACSSASRSEIVIPLFDRTGHPVGVLDIDSDRLDDFSRVDADGLETIAEIIRDRVFIN